jgi:polyferredoxin
MEIPSIPEKVYYRIRLVMAAGWFLLICSLFYDPVSAELTRTNNVQSPFHLIKNACQMFQGKCITLDHYPMGARIFWAFIVPASFFIILVFSHEVWRRICPLAFVSQLPRLLNFQRKKQIKNKFGQTTRHEPYTISKDSWLGQNFLIFQFFLLFIGLNIRLLFTNSDRLGLGIYLVLILALTLGTGYLFGGKTWCQYICPMAPVQLVFTGPRGLFGRQAHLQETKITQSMCREIDKSGIEKSACVACQSPCMDIDSERMYWENLKKPELQLLYYGYLGLALGFYLYFYLYSGRWEFLSGGVWTETNQLTTVLGPGVYLFNHSIASIPKYVAVPVILSTFSALTYFIGLQVERIHHKKLKRKSCSIDSEQAKNQTFAFFAFCSFNVVYFLGILPTLIWMPHWSRELLTFAAVFSSSAWFYRNYKLTAERYKKERLANVLRKELKQISLDYPTFLEGRNVEDLRPDELYILARVLPKISHERQLEIYGAILEEAIQLGNIDVLGNWEIMNTMRQNFNITEADHQLVIDRLFNEDSEIINTYEKPDDKDTSLLCDVLLSKKLISPYQIKIALEEQHASKATFTEVLVEMKFVSQEQLDKIVLEQNLRKKGLWAS